MPDVETLFLELQKKYPRNKWTLSWINPETPVIRVNLQLDKIQFSNENFVFDKKTGDIFYEGKVFAYIVYSKEVTKKHHLFGVFSHKSHKK